MIDKVDRLKKEWHTIKGAPYSFSIVTIILISVCLLAFGAYYDHRMDLLRESESHWKGNAEYWKDQASHPKAQDCPSSPPAVTSSPSAKPQKQTRKETSPTTQLPQQSCPNGICIGGNNAGNPTVNNFGPTTPKIAWSADKDHSQKVQEACVKVSIDRSFLDAKFAMVCERECKAIRGDIVSSHAGFFQTDLIALKAFPKVAGFVIRGPNPMPSDDTFWGCVESQDGNALNVVDVQPLIVE